MGCRHICGEFDVDHRPRPLSKRWPRVLIAPRSAAVRSQTGDSCTSLGMTLKNHKYVRICTSEYKPFFLAHDDNRTRCRRKRRRDGWWPSRRSP